MFTKQQYIVFLLLAIVALAASQGAYLLGNKKHPSKCKINIFFKLILLRKYKKSFFSALADHCYDDENDLTIKVNETIYPTGIDWKCFKVLCRPDFVLQYNK